jgi:hypothetical protein
MMTTNIKNYGKEDNEDDDEDMYEEEFDVEWG